MEKKEIIATDAPADSEIKSKSKIRVFKAINGEPVVDKSVEIDAEKPKGQSNIIRTINYGMGGQGDCGGVRKLDGSGEGEGNNDKKESLNNLRQYILEFKQRFALKMTYDKVIFCDPFEADNQYQKNLDINSFFEKALYDDIKPGEVFYTQIKNERDEKTYLKNLKLFNIKIPWKLR